MNSGFQGVALAGLLTASIYSMAQEKQPLTAQSQRISSGVDLLVVDPSGAVIPRANVVIFDGKKEELANGLTDKRGRFSVGQVPPGTYDVVVRLAPFKTLTRTILVQEHLITELNLKLMVDPVPDPIHHGELGLALVVEDENGALIPTTRISITQEETGATFNALTNPEGTYLALGLAAGNYTLEVERLGFKTHSTSVTIREHEAHSIRITLVVARLINQIRVPGSK
jgi:hypothetical protein